MSGNQRLKEEVSACSYKQVAHGILAMEHSGIFTWIYTYDKNYIEQNSIHTYKWVHVKLEAKYK